METANDFVKSNYLNALFQGQMDVVFRRKLKIHLDNITVPISTVIDQFPSSGWDTNNTPVPASEELSSSYYSKQLTSISFENFCIPVFKENLNIKDISYQQ